jgi:hypothetical protein
VRHDISDVKTNVGGLGGRSHSTTFSPIFAEPRSSKSGSGRQIITSGHFCTHPPENRHIARR